MGAATSAAGKAGADKAAALEAETALISLGYKPAQAARAIATALKEQPELIRSDELIRHALKNMV